MPVDAPVINTVLPAKQDICNHPRAWRTSGNHRASSAPCAQAPWPRARDTLPRRVAE
jgi:hypothetical protein